MMFWMVYVDGHRGPEFQHTSEQGARSEAIRLATMFPGKKVFVLAPTSYAHFGGLVWKKMPEEVEPVKDEDIPDIPF